MFYAFSVLNRYDQIRYKELDIFGFCEADNLDYNYTLFRSNK